MTHIKFFIGVAFFLYLPYVHSAPRYGTQSIHRAGRQHTIRLTRCPESVNREIDDAVFANAVGIVTSMAKIFLDRHNIPEVKQNASNVLTGISNIVQLVTRYPHRFTDYTEEELFRIMVYYLKMHNAWGSEALHSLPEYSSIVIS